MTVVESLQRLAILVLSVVYPIYKSIRVVSKQEDPALKPRLIKYW